MENKNILIIVPMEDKHKKRITEAAKGCLVTYSTPKDVTEEMVSNANIIVGNVPPEYIKSSEKLEFLQLSSSGSDNYVKDGILNKKTILANAAGAYSKAVSEHMFAMTIMLIKKLHIYRDNQNNHNWHDEGTISSLSDATVVIVGLGDIGLSYARMCKAFGAYVIGVKRSAVKEIPEFVDELYTTNDMEKAISRADVVLSIIPSTPETRGMFNKSKFDIMKEGTVFLNGGRGDAVNTDDLMEAVKSGKIGLCGLDVTDPEPLPKDHPLWDMKDVFITPHVAGHYHLLETLERIRNIAINNIEKYVNGENITNVVKH